MRPPESRPVYTPVPAPNVRRPLTDGPARTILEMHRSVGRVRNKKGEPLADVWVTLPDVGTWTSSAADG